MQEIRQLLSEGKTVRQVATQTGYSRAQVQQVADGMKLDRRSKTRGLFGIGVLMVVLGAFVFALVSYHNSLIQKAEDPATWRPIMNRAVDGLMKTYAPDNWLLESDNNDQHTIDREVQISKEYGERLDAALNANLNLPEVKTLKDEFGGKFYTTVFSPNFGGTSRKIFQGSNLEEANKPPTPGFMEVCFFPHNAQSHPRVKGQLLFYSNDWRSLFIGALDYPDKRWFDALAIHELWHAHMHRIGAPSATAPTLSDSWVSEELQAHNLENAVLNNGTNGAYLKLVHSLTGNVRRAVLGEFLAQLTADELISLDKLFDRSSTREGSVRGSQYILTLVNDWLSQWYEGDELQRKQIEAYRTLSRNF